MTRNIGNRKNWPITFSFPFQKHNKVIPYIGKFRVKINQGTSCPGATFTNVGGLVLNYSKCNKN